MGMCRHNVTSSVSFWLVRNLFCDPEQVEGFPTSGNDTENKHVIFIRPTVSASRQFTHALRYPVLCGVDTADEG